MLNILQDSRQMGTSDSIKSRGQHRGFSSTIIHTTYNNKTPPIIRLPLTKRHGKKPKPIHKYIIQQGTYDDNRKYRVLIKSKYYLPLYKISSIWQDMGNLLREKLYPRQIWNLGTSS